MKLKQVSIEVALTSKRIFLLNLLTKVIEFTIMLTRGDFSEEV